MKYSLVFLIMSATICSCNRKWSEEDKTQFVGGCISKAAPDFGDSLAKKYCFCLLDKVMKKYPNANDVGYIKYDTAVARLSRDCKTAVGK
jgi:hypothetical protein